VTILFPPDLPLSRDEIEIFAALLDDPDAMNSPAQEAA
jgi:hypothetical protein